MEKIKREQLWNLKKKKVSSFDGLEIIPTVKRGGRKGKWVGGRLFN